MKRSFAVVRVYRGGCRKDSAADERPAAAQRSAIARRRRSAGTATHGVLWADRDHAAGYRGRPQERSSKRRVPGIELCLPRAHMNLDASDPDLRKVAAPGAGGAVCGRDRGSGPGDGHRLRHRIGAACRNRRLHTAVIIIRILAHGHQTEPAADRAADATHDASSCYALGCCTALRPLGITAPAVADVLLGVLDLASARAMLPSLREPADPPPRLQV